MDSPITNDLKSEIINALAHDEFILYYQPQFNLKTCQFEGVEALIRWQHPRRGLLMPGEFLPFAEQNVLITRIGEWVVKAACEQNKAWQAKGLPPIRMAVNVAGRQLQQENFVDFVAGVLHETQLDPKYLELELTENIIIHDDQTIIQQIFALKELGVSITLDDFGTGYSSISYLKKIPLDRVKIDKSFIEKIDVNHDDAAIVKAIIALTSSLNLQVLAEGVETLKQLQTLMEYDCKEVQGYYFSHPLPAKEVEKFLLLYQTKPFL